MDRDIEYILAVAESGSITQAAKSLYITQPSLSRYITQLETKLGVPLFKRDANGITLTEAGEIYVSHAKNISALYTSLNESLERYKNGDTSKVIRIGFLSTLYLATGALQNELQEKYPDCRIEVMYAKSRDLQKFLDEAKCDLIFGPDCCDHSRYTFTPLVSDYSLLAVPVRYNLEDLAVEREGLPFKWIDIAMIKNLDFVFPDRTCNARLNIDRLLAKRGVEITNFQEFPSTPMSIKAAEDQQGCCFITSGFEGYVSQPEKLRYYVAEDTGNAVSIWGVTRGKRYELTKPEKFCITVIKRLSLAKQMADCQKLQNVQY